MWNDAPSVNPPDEVLKPFLFTKKKCPLLTSSAISKDVTERLPISVIIPTYNRDVLCLRALESVYAQTFLPAEVIVVDDGSEHELTTVKALLAENGGLYVRQDNAGVAAARNAGAYRAEQEWICFLDSDDCWLPEKLAKQFELHESDRSLAISHTPEIWMRNGVRVKQRAHHAPAEGACFARCLDICCISASSVMMQRETFLAHGGFDKDFPVCEDYDLWIRLSRSKRIGLTDEPLVIKYRDGYDQLSASVDAIDVWRVAALRKMLASNCSPSEREMVMNALDKKLAILEAGAKKRGLVERTREFSAIRQAVFGQPL